MEMKKVSWEAYIYAGGLFIPPALMLTDLFLKQMLGTLSFFGAAIFLISFVDYVGDRFVEPKRNTNAASV